MPLLPPHRHTYRNHHICGHYDTAHNVCPGSYSSWDIALHENPEIPPKVIPA